MFPRPTGPVFPRVGHKHGRDFKRPTRLRRSAMTPRAPRVDSTSYVHPLSSVIGDVTLGPKTSVWPFASIRGDVDPIVLGEASNVQDNCVIHTDKGFPVTIGRHVTLGHA